jgi:hypothetical protein
MHARVLAVTPTAHIELRYAVRAADDAWDLPEGPVPESISHATTLQQTSARFTQKSWWTVTRYPVVRSASDSTKSSP